MANLLDFQRLSNFVNGIVDRKIRALSMSITGSTGYLRGLLTQAQSYATESLTHANESRESATEADTAAASTLIVWNEFTSSYVGTFATDPTRSKLNRAINVGAFYIRQADGRLRWATGIDGSNNPVWSDATVTADPTSLAAAGVGVFLSLTSMALQTIRGPVTYQSTVLVPRVTSWTSQQPATATDVNDRLTIVQNSVTAETQRAITAENSIGGGKVNKGGDVMSGALSIIAPGDNASLTIRNNNPSGRLYRFNATDDGRFRLIDESGAAERMYFLANGNAVFNQGVTANSYISSPTLIANRGDGNDSTTSYQTANVPRWITGRSASQQRFYVARMNSSGVFIDTPISVAESDGLVTLNRTIINDTLSTRGGIRADAVGAALVLNNTAGVADTVIGFQNLGYARWYMGRSPGSGVFYINRYTDTGAYVDTPFTISETNGWTTVRNLAVTSAIQASGSISAPVFYAQANGTGRNIAIGDDAWIGDLNIANGFSIRGQGDFNAGYVSFGNSGILLGCNPNDGTLRYGNQTIYHSGNLAVPTADSLGFSYGTSGGIDYSIRPAGGGKRHVTFSGSQVFNSETSIITVAYPFPIEKVVASSATSQYNVGSVSAYHDTFSAFAQPPGLTDVKLFVNKTSSDSVLPVTCRWTVEGILN